MTLPGFCCSPHQFPHGGEASSVQEDTRALHLVTFKRVSHEFSLFGNLKQLCVKIQPQVFLISPQHLFSATGHRNMALPQWPATQPCQWAVIKGTEAKTCYWTMTKNFLNLYNFITLTLLIKTISAKRPAQCSLTKSLIPMMGQVFGNQILGNSHCLGIRNESTREWEDFSEKFCL